MTVFEEIIATIVILIVISRLVEITEKRDFPTVRETVEVEVERVTASDGTTRVTTRIDLRSLLRSAPVPSLPIPSGSPDPTSPIPLMLVDPTALPSK